VNVTKNLSPSPRARGEGRGEGRELRKREQNPRFVAHNGLGVFGDDAPKTWPFGQLKTNSLGQHEKHFLQVLRLSA